MNERHHAGTAAHYSHRDRSSFDRRRRSLLSVLFLLDRRLRIEWCALGGCEPTDGWIELTSSMGIELRLYELLLRTDPAPSRGRRALQLFRRYQLAADPWIVNAGLVKLDSKPWVARVGLAATWLLSYTDGSASIHVDPCLEKSVRLLSPFDRICIWIAYRTAAKYRRRLDDAH